MPIYENVGLMMWAMTQVTWKKRWLLKQITEK